MTIDYDRELLWATSTRHLAHLPVPVSNAISAAIDELIDPLTLPALVDVDETATDDVPAVITAVRGRHGDHRRRGTGLRPGRPRTRRRPAGPRRRHPGHMTYTEDATRLARAVAALTAHPGQPERWPALSESERPAHQATDPAASCSRLTAAMRCSTSCWRRLHLRV